MASERDKRIEQIAEKYATAIVIIIDGSSSSLWFPEAEPRMHREGCRSKLTLLLPAVSEAWARGEAEAYRKAAELVNFSEITMPGILRVITELERLAREAEERK